MPDTKITALAAITTVAPANDLFAIVDVSDNSMAASGTTKNITTNQILGAGGTATLASATITGDLTVDTSTLKVDSTNNRVGILTASPRSGFALDVLGRVAIGSSTTTGATPLVIDGLGTAGNVPSIQFRSANVTKAYVGLTGSYLGDTSTDLLLGTDAAGAAIRFFVSDTGTEAMRLNSTVLAIGVTPNTWTIYKALQVQGASIFSTTGNDTGFGSNVYYDGGYKFRSASSDKATRYEQFGGSHSWHYTASAGTAGNAATFTQAMTLDASGNLLVGTTSQIRNGKLSVDSSAGVASGLKTSAGSSVFVEELWNTGSLDNSFINFGTDSTFTARGSITYNRSGGLVAYNTTSDYRAKDIIGPVSNSGSVIDSLKVYIGKMKGASIERPMLVAHEAQIVAPYSVTGQKDEVDADGNPKYQQMDVSSFVPLLIAEIQSLRTRVAALEA